MVEHQGPRRYSYVKIMVSGVDVTDTLNPYLISVQVIDTLSGTDKCNLELDDRNAQLQLPPDGVSLTAVMGWRGEGPRPVDYGRNHPMSMSSLQRQQEAKFGGPGGQLVFAGRVTNVESGFGRKGGGRRVWIEAEGNNSKSQGKEMQMGSYGEGLKNDSEQKTQAGKGAEGKIPFQQAADDVFKKAGISVKLSPEMAKMKRDFWSITGESAQAWGERMAREMGGDFKIANGIATFTGTTEMTNADGRAMPTVEAVWGINLIGWRIKPYSGRPQWKNSAGRIFDLNNAEWKKIAGEAIGGQGPFGAATAVAQAAGAAPDGNVASQNNNASDGTSKRRRGEGWALLNGEPGARAGGYAMIKGARPGVDGGYKISEVEHNYTRGVGYTTRVTVQFPTPDPDVWGWGVKDAKTGKITSPKPPGASSALLGAGVKIWTDEEINFMVNAGTLTPEEAFRIKRNQDAIKEMAAQEAAAAAARAAATPAK